MRSLIPCHLRWGFAKESKKTSSMFVFLCPEIKLKTSFHLISGHKKTALSAVFQSFAEREGFEPTVPCGTMVFKTIAIDHSATSPFILTSTKVIGFSVIPKGFEIKI